MRATFILGTTRRRDTRQHPGKGKRARVTLTAEDLSLRRSLPEEFVTSPDQGGRQRLLERFDLARRARRAL